MSEIIANATWDTFWYFFLGAPLTVAAFILAMVALSPAAFLLGVERSEDLVRRSALFVAILFACGVPGNAIFTAVMRGRYYYAADPLVDWLPWFPDPAFPLDVSCGGHYVNGASGWTVLLAWIIVAIPVWGVSIALFRWIQRDKWLRV
jgi:hypothetical protein